MHKTKSWVLSTDLPLFFYFISTIFMIFLSVPAIHDWPDRWAQITISLACILTTLSVFIKNIPTRPSQRKNWPKELKLVLIIMLLGAFNIYFSEDRSASLKGMGLFLMSGILIFSATFFLFQSRKNQNLFLMLCFASFVALTFYGIFEFFQSLIYSGRRILLLSSNPIPAGSLLILLSTGPLLLFSKTKFTWQKVLLFSFLLLGILLIFLIGQRGPIATILVMGLIWGTRKRQALAIFTLTLLALIGVGYLFKDVIPMQYKKQLLKKETILVRLEFYNVAWQVIKDKPFWGVGFNAPIKKYVPDSYKPKFYPTDSKYTFPSIITGVETFDNMALFFLGQTGLLFSGVYGYLIFYLIKNWRQKINENADIKQQSLLLLTVLIGFAIHSMTYDSLRYPHLNWLFHSLLGLMANYSLFQQEVPLNSRNIFTER